LEKISDRLVYRKRGCNGLTVRRIGAVERSSRLNRLLHKRIKKANPRRKLTVEEAKLLAKLESIADKLKRGNVLLILLTNL